MTAIILETKNEIPKSVLTRTSPFLLIYCNCCVLREALHDRYLDCDWLASRFVSWSAKWPITWLAGCPDVGWWASWLVGWLDSLLAG